MKNLTPIVSTGPLPILNNHTEQPRSVEPAFEPSQRLNPATMADSYRPPHRGGAGGWTPLPSAAGKARRARQVRP